jgi:hypothetical protein
MKSNAKTGPMGGLMTKKVAMPSAPPMGKTVAMPKTPKMSIGEKMEYSKSGKM